MYDSSQIGFTLTSILKLAHKLSVPRDFRGHLLKKLLVDPHTATTFYTRSVRRFLLSALLKCVMGHKGKQSTALPSCTRPLLTVPLLQTEDSSEFAFPSEVMPPSQSTNIYPAFMYLQPSTKMNEAGQPALKYNGNLERRSHFTVLWHCMYVP